MDDIMNRRMDLWRFILTAKRKIWKAFAAAAVCAAAAAGLYLLFTYVLAGERLWRSDALYYIDFDEEYMDITKHYYNDFTWNDVIDTDRIAGKAAALCGIGKEEIAGATSIPTMSDIRMIRVYVDMKDAKTADLVQDAMGEALAAFGAETEGFCGISPWDRGETKRLDPEDHVLRFTVFGAVAGFIFGLLCMLYEAVLDDALCTEEDVRFYTGYDAAGIYKKGADPGQLALNLKKIFENTDGIETVFFERDEDAAVRADILEMAGKKEDADAASLLILAGWGRSCGRRLARYIKDRRLQGKEKISVVLLDADERFLRAYYGA